MVGIRFIQDNISKELAGLNEIIESSLQSASPLMQQVVQKFLEKKGKQIRPVLVILSGQLFGEITPKVLNAGAAIELLHNASLIHDDVIDESKERRGYATINRIWDNHIAVLVGDFFVSSALHCAVETQEFRIINSMSRLGRELSLGEINQIDFARQHNIEESTYFDIIRHKTASLFRSCVEVGGYAAGATEDELRQITEYAELLGLCFQIKDDIFDYFDDEEEIGKPTGNDLREGKLTLPLIHALSKTDVPEHQSMVDLCAKPQLTEAEIATLIEFAKEQGGIEYAYATMERLRDKAFAIIDGFAENSSVKSFKALFSYIIQRNK